MKKFLTSGIVVVSVIMLTACAHPVDNADIATTLPTEVITETETETELISITPLTSEYRLTDSMYPGFPLEIQYLKEDADSAEYIFLSATCDSGQFVQWESGYESQPIADVTLIRDDLLRIYWIPEEGVTGTCNIAFTVYYSNLAVPIKTIAAQLLLSADNIYTFSRP